MPSALIALTASMRRVTTTGASPSNRSSRSRTEGRGVRARLIATIFFWPPERDLPDAHREEPHDAVDRRRLPRAVSADEADRLAVVDGERDATEDLRRPAVGVDAVELEHRSRHGQGARVVPMSVVVTASLRRISSGVPSARIVPWCMATIRSE